MRGYVVGDDIRGLAHEARDPSSIPFPLVHAPALIRTRPPLSARLCTSSTLCRKAAAFGAAFITCGGSKQLANQGSDHLWQQAQAWTGNVLAPLLPSASHGTAWDGTQPPPPRNQRSGLVFCTRALFRYAVMRVCTGSFVPRTHVQARIHTLSGILSG